MNTKVFILVLLCALLAESRRSGGSRSSSARRQTTRRPSQSRNVNTVSQNRATTPYRPSNVATQRPSNVGTQRPSNVGTPSGNKAVHVTTPRYNLQTHRNYPQQSHTQSGYNNRPTQGYGQANRQPTGHPGYQQPGYNAPGYQKPGYHQPSYQQPGYSAPGYNSYNRPGSWYGKKDHSVRNSVFAGLGGSALGLYLGYKLGSLGSGGMHGPLGGYGGVNNNNQAYPSYSVVHHYHHGDKEIPKESNVESKIIQKCENIDFCTPNTTPVCLSNGTIYCTALLEATIPCNMNGTDYKCVNSSIQVPCENSTDVNCTTTSSISIPCVTIINIFGDFSTNTLTIHKISKRAEDEVLITTTEVVTTTLLGENTTFGINTTQNIMNTTQNMLNTTRNLMETTTPIVVNDEPASSSINNGGINTKMCVTVIADPVKPPEISEHPKNEEFIDYVASNPTEQEKVDSRFGDVLGNILNFLFV